MQQQACDPSLAQRQPRVLGCQRWLTPQPLHPCNPRPFGIARSQMLALFRDYDVVWPGATKAVLSWSELANIGFMMMAPGQRRRLLAREQVI